MDWTPSSNSVIRPYRAPLGSPHIRYFDASTAAVPIVVGDIVQFDTAVASNAHRIVRAQSTGGGGANLLGVNGDRVLGVAMNADPTSGSTLNFGTDNRQIGVALFDGHTEFLAYTRWAGPVVSSLIGQNRSIIYDSTLKIWQIDSTNSTAALQTAIITDIPAGVSGDTGAPVIFKISAVASTLISPVARS